MMKLALALVSLTFVTAGCDGKKASAPTATPAKAATPEPSKPTSPLTLDQLKTITLPPPPKVGGSGSWLEAFASTDGDRLVVWKDGDKTTVGVEIIDCRTKDAVDAKAEKPSSQGRFAGCYAPATDKLKGFDLVKPTEIERVVRAGNLTVKAYVYSDTKVLTPAELEEYLGKLDLDGISKK